MPPRKSNVSTASISGEASNGAAVQSSPVAGKEKKEKDKDKDEIAIEDLTMPRTMIQRLAKGVLPPNTQLQKDAVTALAKSATVFVSHITGAASDQCLMANRRTVNPADVFAALRETEHAAMVPRLEKELAKWVDVNTSKRNEYRRKMRENKETKDAAEAGEDVNPTTENEPDGRERATKRVKGEDGVATAAGDDDTMDVDYEEGEGQEEEDDDAEEEEDEDEDDHEDEEDGAEEEQNELDMDPAAAQLERESRAVNDGSESDAESD